LNARKTALDLYPYQQRWLADTSRFKIGLWSRQVGKTFTSTLELVLDCVEAEAKRQRRRWVILSRGERQAAEAMNSGVKLHLKALKIGFDENDYEWSPDVKALEVTLPGGSRITALPASPDTARGFSGSVLSDEFAFHKDSRAIWQALFPVISAGYRIIVISTPNGTSGKFYELWTGQDNAWSKHQVDIYQAVADGLPRNIEELKKGLNDQDAWEVEFECKFREGDSNWITHDLIDGCEDALAGDPTQWAGEPVFIGVDVGLRRDLTCFWVVERVGDVLWTRQIVTMKGENFSRQEERLAEVVNQYQGRVARICVDQTGMGEGVVENFQKRFGSSRVEGIIFSGPNKLVLATGGKQAFEDRKLRLPMGDPDLRADLRKLRKTVTATGAARFEAERDEAGHADRAWACFLAIHAASQGRGEFDYYSADAGPAIPDYMGGLAEGGDWRTDFRGNV
jgi:phage FluMu gp28-like protein